MNGGVYVPWTGAEDAALLAEYNSSGMAAARRALPGRSRNAIAARLRKLRAEGAKTVRRIGRNSARADAIRKPEPDDRLPAFDSTGFLERLSLMIPARKKAA